MFVLAVVVSLLQTPVALSSAGVLKAGLWAVASLAVNDSIKQKLGEAGACEGERQGLSVEYEHGKINEIITGGYTLGGRLVAAPLSRPYGLAICC